MSLTLSPGCPQVSCSPCSVPVGTPVSGYALYQRHIKAMHESALLEEQRQRQEQLDMEYRSAVSPCGTSKSPSVEWEGWCSHTCCLIGEGQFSVIRN